MQLFNGFLGFIQRGGPVMIALLACSILVVAVVFERVVFYLRQRIDVENFMRGVAERVAAGDVTGAARICERHPSVLARVIRAGLARSTRSRADILDALSTASRRYLRGLEQNLAVLGTIAVIAPFVGLFGTVLGIIHAFDDIALKGNSSPAVVAAGVSEALITTAAGLFVAVLAVIFFNYFRNRARMVREDVLWAAEQLAEFLHFQNTGGLQLADVTAILDEKPAEVAR